MSTKLNIRVVLLLACVVGFGAMIKNTFLPLALAYALIGTWHIILERNQLRSVHKKLAVTDVVLIGLLLVSVGLFAERYIGNIIDYGEVDVACEQIHTEANCFEFGLYRRNSVFAESQYPVVISTLPFIFAWSNETVINILGTQTWVSSARPPVYLLISVTAITLLATIAACTKLRFKTAQDKAIAAVFITSVSYIIINMLVNYSIYRRTGRFGLALQGRYVLPITIPFLLSVGVYLLQLMQPIFIRVKWSLVLPLGLVLVVGLSSGLQIIMRKDSLVEEPFAPRYLQQKDTFYKHYDLTE